MLRGLIFVRCYIHDIVVSSNTLEEHVQHLQQVFQRLREAGLKVHPGKCVFAAENIGSQSLTMLAGTPWARITCCTNSAATSGAGMDLVVGMKIAILVRRSTTTRIASW